MSYTHSFLDGGEVRERDIYLSLVDPATGAELTDPSNPLFVAVNASDSSIAAIPGYDGRIVVSYYDESAGYVIQQTANVVATITGDAAGQSLRGRPGVAVAIDGGGGNDTLNSSDGDDTLLGGTGDDTIRLYRGDDVVDGGTGTDTLNAGGYGPITLDLTKTGPQVTGIGTKTIRGIENLTGVSSSSETLIGDDRANVLDGGGLPGGFQPGLDTLVGNGGNDTYIVNRPDTVVRESSASGGTDLVKSHDDFTLPTNVENLVLLDDAYDGIGTGNALANTIFGNRFGNSLDGKGGADTLAGLGGNDTYVVNDAGDRVVEAANAGTDRVLASVSYALAAGQSIERLSTTGSTGTVAINLTGNEIANTLQGNAGANILNGGVGADSLQGLGGNDTFAFSTTLGSGNVDRIVDFSVPADQIRLSRSVFSDLPTGGLAGSAFKDLAVASIDADDRILYNQDTGVLAYDRDGAGGTAAVQFALLDNRAILTNADVFVV